MPQSISVSISATTPQTISVPIIATSPIIITPASLTFSHGGSPSQAAVVSGGIPPYTVGSSSPSIATASISGSNVYVTPVSVGTSTVTVTDLVSGTATFSASVGANPGPLLLSKSSLTATVGTRSGITFSASRAGDTDPFSVSSSPSGIVDVSGSGSGPGPVTYTIVPLSPGNATITVTAADRTTATLSLIVTGPLSAVVTSPPNSTLITISVSEQNYSGVITPSILGTTTASVSPGSAFGPIASFSVTDSIAGELFYVRFNDLIGNSTTIAVQSASPSLGLSSITFFDETGINPVAAGSQYQAYYQGASQTPENVVASGFIGVGGVASFTVHENSNYIIEWIGQQAPTGQTTFSTGTVAPVSVTVSGYRSPYSSTLGYAVKQTEQWTRRWNEQKYRDPGPPGTTGMAYNLAYSFASIIGEGGNGLPGLDSFLQGISVATRLYNCSGSAIDSWFQDFLGPSFKRQSGELDAAFIQRGIIAMNGKVATRDALNEATNSAWKSIGNSGTIVCDDSISNPSLMSTIGYAAPYFVVTLPSITDVTDVFFLDERYLGIDTFLLELGFTAPLSRSLVPLAVQQAVESKRALGCLPLYIQTII
jgi:hypothetical protein